VVGGRLTDVAHREHGAVEEEEDASYEEEAACGKRDVS
jgi:hypothetical protein